MDPMNNPTPNPTPTPNPNPNPVPPNPAPSADTTPSSAPMAAGGINSNPVNPVVTPSNPGNPVAPANLDGQLTSSPFNPALNPNGIGATDPIMRPEPAKGPDPIEEELKAPMKAAGPAPGSIGSAVSGPAQGNTAPTSANNPFGAQGNTPNVSFNDPATQPENPAMNGSAPVAPAGNPKKPNKTTLIALIAVAAVVIIVLIVVLVMSLNSGGGSSSSNNNTSTAVEENVDEEGGSTENATQNETSVANTLSCVRNMTAAELAEFGGERQAVIDVEIDFDDNDEMVYASVLKSGVYQEGEVENKEDMNSDFREVAVANLSDIDATEYYLPVDENGNVVASFDEIQTHLESLDFTCQVL